MSSDEKTVDDRLYKILIVDDEEDVLNALRLTLERAKQFKSEISIANSGEAALKEIGKKGFDLVMSDYKMPGMNGVELLAEVKEKHPDTVRMLITGYTDINIAKEAINKAKVYNYIEKPWDNEDVRLTIYEALKRKSERECKDVAKVDKVNDALTLINEFQEKLLLSVHSGEPVSEHKLTLEFDSVSEFNKFSFEVKHMKNVRIEDAQMFESKYIISVAIYPLSYERIK